MGHKCVNDEKFYEIRRDNVKYEMCMCNDLKVMCNQLVTALIIELLLIVSGNVKLNPGPMKKCLKCEKMMPTRSNNCKCGYLLCRLCCCEGSALHIIPLLITGRNDMAAHP